MVDSPKKEIISLSRAMIEIILKSSDMFSARILALLVSPRSPTLDGPLQLLYPIDAYLLCTQLYVGYKATSALCKDIIEQALPDSDSITMGSENFLLLLDLSTSTKSWENELSKKYNLTLTLQ
jgi:hypothetical protein